MPRMTQILVLAALRSEVLHLKNMVSDAVPCGCGGIRYAYQAHVGKVTLHGIQTGIGMAAAASAAEYGILKYKPDAIFNFGSAGAHVRDIIPGDVVIGTQTDTHSAMLVLQDGEEIHLPSRAVIGDEATVISSIPGDPILIDLAKQASKGWTPDMWHLRAPYAYRPHRSPMVRSGVVVTSDSWIQSTARIDVLHRRHNSLCVDMEAAAAAQVASMHNIPFLTIKDVTNNQFYEEVSLKSGNIVAPLEEAGRRSADLVYRLLKLLSEQA